MAVYGGRSGKRSRPALRQRLTVMNGALLAGAWAVMVVLAWGIPDSVLGGGPLVRAALGLVIIGLVAVVGGYTVAGRALRPLQQITTLAHRLSGESFDQRIRYVGADDEVAELARTFDAMLDRLSTAFDSQRRFVANASHELRTPLAVMRTEIDVTVGDSEADLAEYRRMATVVRDASIRANSLVESLLFLARTEAQAGRRLVKKVPVDLRSAVEMALSAVSRDIDRIDLRVTTDLENATVVGDPELLDRLVGNLIENAVRYNHLGGELGIRLREDETAAQLVVTNTGFEVDSDDVPGLFEPFRRGGRERTGFRGSGLGLSIVRAVCDAHGGAVGATANEGGGLEVTVTLPSAAMTPVLSGSAQVSLS